MDVCNGHIEEVVVDIEHEPLDASLLLSAPPSPSFEKKSSRGRSFPDVAVPEGHPRDTDFLPPSRHPDELLTLSTDAISAELSRKAVAPIEPDTVEVLSQQDLEEEHDEKCHLPELLPQAATVLVTPLPLPPKEIVLVPAADESTEEQRQPMRLPSVSMGHRKWVHPIPIHLSGKQEELEQQLVKVHKLAKNEHMIAAHSEYLKLVQMVDNVLVDNHLQVFGLVRPPFYLRHLHDSDKDPEPQILRNNLQSIEGTDTVHCLRIWGNTPSLTRILSSPRSSDPNWERENPDWDRSGFLSRKMSDRLESSEFSHQRDKVLRGSLEADAHHFSPLGAAILEEPVTALPLRSQQLDAHHEFQDDDDKQAAVQRVLDLCSYDPGDHESKMYLGRRVLRKRVWPLGDLPCIGFTVQDNASDTSTHDSVKSLLAEQARDEMQQDPDTSETDSTDSFCYTYAKRTVAGLSLPVDIQVIFLLSSASPSTTGEDPAIVQRRQSSATSFPGAGIPPDGASERMKNQGTDVATDAETLQLWKWFHYFLEKVINNPQIHKMRIQHYRTELSSVVLSADFTSDKSWSVSKTADYRHLYKVNSDGNCFTIIEGFIKAPLFVCLSLINESSLYKNWVPFLSDSGRIHQVATFTQVIRQHCGLPWPLDDRESIMFGYAVDLLDSSRPSVVMNGVAVPDPVTSCFGLPISPPKPGVTRLLVKMFTFQLIPDREDPLKTELKQIIFFDPQMSFIPKAVHAFVAKQMAVRLFNNIQNLSKGFRGSVYETRVQQNPQLYGMIQSRLDSFYRELPNAIPDPTITQNSDKKQEPKG